MYLDCRERAPSSSYIILFYFSIESDLENLLPLVDEYHVTHLKGPIEKCLLQKPSLQRLALADRYGLTKLREVCLKYAKRNDTSSWDFEQLQPSTQVEMLLPKLAAANTLISDIDEHCNGGGLCRGKSCPGTYCPELGKNNTCHYCLRFRIETIQEKIRKKYLIIKH